MPKEKGDLMMNKVIAALLAAAMLQLNSPAPPARAEVNISLNIGINDRNFLNAISLAYVVPVQNVIYVYQQGIPEDDIPVVYYIAQQADVDPSAVVALRL